jgi:serine/threonine protein kinase
MGEVFVARTPWDERRVAAVKRLRPDVARVPTFADRFKHESQLAVRLEHPNVVGTIDVGAVDQQLYVASDLVLGKDAGMIADRLRERGQGAPVAVVVRILLDVLDALAYVHGAREPDGRWLALVHRDVTPGNVLISYEGHACLADFGLAKSALTEASNLTGHGEIIGTPHYLAPEVIRGEKAGKAADIYGLGAVVYRVLTGVAPYQGNAAEVLFKALTEAPRPLIEWRPDLPPWLVAFVSELLERDSTKRPYDAALLRSRLEHDAKAAKVLLPSASVGRWLCQLFEAEHAKELEEYQAISALLPSSVPGEGTGTLVLAHARQESALSAPPRVQGTNYDLENAGTELDFPGGAENITSELRERLRRGLIAPATTPSMLDDDLEALPTRAAPLVEVAPKAVVNRAEDISDEMPTHDPDEETLSPQGDDDERTYEDKKRKSLQPPPGFVDSTAPGDVTDLATAVTDLDAARKQGSGIEDRLRPRIAADPALVPVARASSENEAPAPRPVVPPRTPAPARPVDLPRPSESNRPTDPPPRVFEPQRAIDQLPRPADLVRPVQEPQRALEPARPAAISSPPPQQPQKKASSSVWSSVFPVIVAAVLAIGAGIGIGLWLSAARQPTVIDANRQQQLALRFDRINARIAELTAKGDTIPADVTRLVSETATAIVTGDLARAELLIPELEQRVGLGPKPAS